MKANDKRFFFGIVLMLVGGFLGLFGIFFCDEKWKVDNWWVMLGCGVLFLVGVTTALIAQTIQQIGQQDKWHL